MSSLEPDRARIRQVIAAAVVVLFLVVGALALKDSWAPAPAPPAKAPAGARGPAIAAPQPLAVPSPYLGRAELLAAAAAASAAYAGGEAPNGPSGLVGRTFRLRIPFGCSGPGQDGDDAYWQYDEKTRTLRIRAAPTDWSDTAWVAQVAGDTAFDAVEGFWIPRPWSNADECPPPVAAGEAPAAPSPQTFGVAEFFEPGGSRLQRRGARAYEHVLKIDEPPAGRPVLSLVLGGRITGFADGQAVRCHGDTPDHRPVCLAAVDLDYVAFEDQGSGAILAEWRN